MTDSGIARLSLEQKASLLSGRDGWTTTDLSDEGVPSMTMIDGPHGLRRPGDISDHLGIAESLPATCFPPAVAVGSSWDPDVAAAVATGIAREARCYGVQIVLGPGVNIKRSPLGGRNFEFYSEDPLVSGVLGAAYVAAMQDAGVGVSLKHFAVNNQETGRMQISADVDERTLREIYLASFERVVTQSQPATVMCSYNRINGVYASENEWLLNRVLRDEWGFEGAVVSDWGAVHDRVAALRAGLDLEMPGKAPHLTDIEIVDAVRDGRLDDATVDRSAARVAALTRLVQTPLAPPDLQAQHELAQRLATECAVLLKNDRHVLPLSPDSTVAVVGVYAAEPRFQGGGSSHVRPTRVDNALDAIRAIAADVTYARDGEDGALHAARDADVTLVFAGLDEHDESEGYDRASMELPAEQVALIQAVAAVSARTVVVLSHGGVVSLEGWHDDVDAILDTFLLGQGGGQAIADLVFGVASPSGRLAESIPRRLEDNPSFLNFPGEQGHVRYGEGVMVGYRYYETTGVPVRYPFGHGLSYTTFTTSDLQVETSGTDQAVARVTVTNTGARPGKHVVQLYVASSAGPVRRPARELRAFRKVELAPNESTTVEFALDRRAFAYWDIVEGDWIVPGGEHAVQIGENASNVLLEKTVTLTGDVILRELSLESTVGDWLAHPVVGPTLLEAMLAAASEEEAEAVRQNPDWTRLVESIPMYQFVDYSESVGSPINARWLEPLMELTRPS